MQIFSSQLTGPGIPVNPPDHGPGIYRAYTDNPSFQSVGKIRFVPANPANVVTFFIADPIEQNIDPGGPLTPGSFNFGGFITTGTRVRFQASVNGDLHFPIRGDLGGEVDIVRLDFGGDLLADVTHAGATVERITANNIASGIVVQTVIGRIRDVVLSGSNFGTIRASGTSAFLDNVTVAGDIGLDANNPGVVSSQTGLQNIAATNIFGIIDSRQFINVDFGGPLRSLIATGDFVGTITTTNLTGLEIRVNGDFDGRLRIGSIFGTGTPLFASQRVVIGGSFVSGSDILLPSNGLAGRIIINESAGIGVWNGKVVFGSSSNPDLVLEPPAAPEYPDLASSLGGGAVGLAPFALHGADCTPVISTCIAIGNEPSSINPIKMRHYGPVIWNGPTNGDPFTIERRGIGLTMNPWIDQTACFTPTLDPANDTIVVLTPNLTLPLQSGFEYRVTLRHIGDNPANEFVLRSNVPTLPPVAAHAAQYVFSVGELSLGDADSDGDVDFNDINAVLANWLTTDCLRLGDADRDGVVVFNDINAVLSNWLMVYPGCTPPCLEGPASSSATTTTLAARTSCDRTMADAIKAMGFESSKQFMKWFGDLAPDEQLLVFTGLDEWLACQR